MNIKFMTKDITLSEHAQKKMEQKFEKFKRYFDDKANMTVQFSEESNNFVKVEITMKIDRHYYRAESTSKFVVHAAEDAIHKMERSIRKHKSKIETQIRNFAYMNEYFKYEDHQEKQVEEDDKQAIHIKRKKKIEVIPMLDEEAALQMELLNHDFFVYKDVESGGYKVIYKRKEGHYGVIDIE